MEKMIRESPPECLNDPELGKHLYVKINVRDDYISFNYNNCSFFLRIVNIIMLKTDPGETHWSYAFMILRIFGMVGEINLKSCQNHFGSWH